MSLATALPATATTATAADFAHVRSVVTAAGSSFFWAMRFLPPHKREAVFAVYAFCREVDDIADGDQPSEAKQAALQDWREEIERLYEERPTRATARVLVSAVRQFDLRKEDFTAVIDGMEMDALGPLRAPSMATLELYCARVAGAVGRLCVRIFGESGAAGQRTATCLGRALQLTNILRDLEEDAALGRLYLPAELLAAHGIAEHDPQAVLRHPHLPRVCRDLADLAEQAFQEAEEAIADCSRAKMRPSIIMMMVYRKTLERLRASDWADLGGGTQTRRLQRYGAKLEKLWIALRYGVF